MVGTLSGLQDHLRLAREYANEGLYDTSVIFFDGAIAQINKHMSSLDDPLIGAKWMNCKKSLTEEIETVKQLDTERRSLKESLGNNNNNNNSNNRRVNSPPISTKGGGSFVFQPLDEYPTSSNAPPIDDPDVWAPPNRGDNNGNRRGPNNRQMGTRKSAQDRSGSTRGGAAAGRGGGKATNSARSTGAGARSSAASGTTGKKAAGSSKSKSESANDDSEEKKRPEYEGPDPELAAMLERDVLETSPGVRWDDVAGLKDAKRLLEEAVVLPLWMPGYFQVTRSNTNFRNNNWNRKDQ